MARKPGKEYPGAKTSLGRRLELTGLQEAFALYYLGEANLNGVRACEMAGYSGNKNTLAVVASENLRHRKILEFMDAVMEQDTLSETAILKLMSDDAAGVGGFIKVVDTIVGNEEDGFAKVRVPMVDWDAVVNAGKAHLIREIEKTREGWRIRWADPHQARVELLKRRDAIAERKAKHTLRKQRADGSIETTTVEGTTAAGAAAIFSIGAIADALEAAVEEVCGRASGNNIAEDNAEGA